MDAITLLDVLYGEDVLEDTECSVEESVMQRMDIERVRTALKMLAPEERAIIQDFFHRIPNTG